MPPLALATAPWPLNRTVSRARGNRAREDQFYEELDKFFGRIIRDETTRKKRKRKDGDRGGGEDEEEEVLEIGTVRSKGMVFKRWCLERGHVVHTDVLGNVTVARRSDEDDTTTAQKYDPRWIVGNVSKPVCSWTCCQRYWMSKHPNLVPRMFHSNKDLTPQQDDVETE